MNTSLQQESYVNNNLIETNYDEKINYIMNNRNLNDYSCFTGTKTFKVNSSS